MQDKKNENHVVVIGGGFTGLAAAYELNRRGIAVTLLEKDEEIGGLAASFKINKDRLEKFYHHWFINDKHIIQLAKDLGVEDQLQYDPTRTGIYLNRNFYRLSKPTDVLRFPPLTFYNRLRLGRLVLQARRIKDWKPLEALTARQWLLELCGPEVYRVVWEPLMRGKFGPYADEISAVWFWNKLVLRGGSRDRSGKEVLVYFRGGFAAFADTVAREIISGGGKIQTAAPAQALIVHQGRVKAVQTPQGVIDADAVIATPGLPIIADLLEPHVDSAYLARLRRIVYLANVCLVLELSQSLSEIYWLNVNDPDFPFIGVIEHTNFQPSETCGDRHIVYLSQYLPPSAELFQMQPEKVFEFAGKHLKRMFPKFDESWVYRYHVWKAPYAQPVVERHYSRLIPASEAPLKGIYLASMAQIYPEDRGTNYAVHQGREIARRVAKQIIKV